MSYNNDLVNDQLKKLVDLFSSKDANELKQTISKAYIEGLGKPIHNWSLGNQLLVLIHKTNDARTINQWRSVGRHLKKGTKAIYILRPNQSKIKKLNKDTNEYEDIFILNGFSALPVYKFEDTYGAGLKKYEPKEPLILQDVAKKWGLKIEYDSSSHGEYGSFNPRENKITLCTEDQTTFFHELAHKAHSKIEKLKNGQDLEQELIAQLSACVLGSLFGFDVKAYTFDYISSYVGSKDPNVIGKSCLRVLSKVQKILKMILENTEAEIKDNKTEIIKEVNSK